MFVLLLLLSPIFVACLCIQILNKLKIPQLEGHSTAADRAPYCFLLKYVALLRTTLIQAMISNLNLISLFNSFNIRTLISSIEILSFDCSSQLTILPRIYERDLYFAVIYLCLYPLNHNDFQYHTLCHDFQANWDHLKLDNFTSLQGDCG